MTVPAEGQEPYDAIILAGGAGSRLGGVDKAAVDLAGRPLIAASLAAVPTAATVVVVGATRAALPDKVLHTVEDPAGGGPAAATAAGLRAVPSPAPWTALLACDLPGAEAALPRLRAAASSDGAVLLDPDGRRQWVLGVYRTAALVAAVQRLGTTTNASMRGMLGDLDLIEVPAVGTEWHDVDTWDDHRTWADRLTGSTHAAPCED